jgi:hypothetical protein
MHTETIGADWEACRRFVAGAGLPKAEADGPSVDENPPQYLVSIILGSVPHRKQHQVVQ